MADVFNQSPENFVDLNTLFPVLNDRVGLTSAQWQKAIENTFYLYNNLGLADVAVGTVETQFTSPGTFSDVIVTHREELVEGKVFDFFDYVFKIPTPNIVATMQNERVAEDSLSGMNLVQTPILQTINEEEVTVGYTFAFTAKFPALANISFCYIHDPESEEEEFTEDWLTGTIDGEPLIPNQSFLYIIRAEGDFYNKIFVWNGIFYENLTDYYTKTQADTKFVEKVEGKGLSSNDFTEELKNKLTDITIGYDFTTHTIDHAGSWFGEMPGSPNPSGDEGFSYYKINISEFTIPYANYTIIVPLQEERKAFPCEFYSKVLVTPITGELVIYCKNIPTESFDIIIKRELLHITEVGLGVFITPNRFQTAEQTIYSGTTSVKTKIDSKESTIKKYLNIEVLTTDFVADATYTDYGFRATVPLTGVIATDIPTVNFSGTDIALEIFAPFVDSYEGGVYIYASEVPSGTITIPNIYCVVGV